MKSRAIIIKTIVITLILVILLSYYNLPIHAEENETLHCGLLWDDENLPEYDENLYQTSIYGLPTSVDLSDSVSFPPVRDQGLLNSCYAWATVYYQFGYQVAAMNNWNVRNDTSKQFSPRFIHNLTNNGINQGGYAESSYSLLKSQGAVRFNELIPGVEANDEEITKWCTDANALKTALKYKVSEYTKMPFASTHNNRPITSVNSNALKYMKCMLSYGYPLTIGTYFGETKVYFEGSSRFHSSGWKCDLLSDGDLVCYGQEDIDGENKNKHLMCIVGYDDNIWYDYNGNQIVEDFEKGAFKLVNSHGTDFGNNGFIWVMYDALNINSGYSLLNTANRNPIFLDYIFFYIEVHESNLDLLAEVTIEHRKRKQLDIDLGLKEGDNTDVYYTNTMFYGSGGNIIIGGKNSNIYGGSFYFDYDILTNGNNRRMNYYTRIIDKVQGTAAVIVSVRWIDCTGKVVAQDTVNDYLDNDTMILNHYIGMVGDIDNNGQISVIDGTLIQRHLAAIELLTNSDDLILADVDADNDVTILDSLSILRFLAGLESAFANGKYSKLD